MIQLLWFSKFARSSKVGSVTPLTIFKRYFLWKFLPTSGRLTCPLCCFSSGNVLLIFVQQRKCKGGCESSCQQRTPQAYSSHVARSQMFQIISKFKMLSVIRPTDGGRDVGYHKIGVTISAPPFCKWWPDPERSQGFFGHSTALLAWLMPYISRTLAGKETNSPISFPLVFTSPIRYEFSLSNPNSRASVSIPRKNGVC